MPYGFEGPPYMFAGTVSTSEEHMKVVCARGSNWDCIRISYWVETVSGWGWGWLWNAFDVIAFFAVIFFICRLVQAIFLASPQSVTRYGALKTKRVSDGTRKLLRDFTIKVGEEKPIKVNKGFITDYSSIPTSLQWTMNWSKVDVAGVVHDWLYANAGIVQKEMTRKETDDVWRSIALKGKHSANRLQAALGWLALRSVGWIIWNRYRANPPSHLLPNGEKCCEDSKRCDC